MIVTRKRKKPFPLKRLILPVVALALVAFAFVWGPSRNAMSSGPMAPAVRTTGDWFDKIAVPFHFAAQNQVITDRNRQISALQAQLATAKTDSQGKDKKIADLQKQLDQTQTQLASASSNAAQASTRGAALGQSSPRPGPSDVALAGSDLSVNSSPDMKRTADYWAAMDPENAAKVAQRLPPSYVARVLALMPAESVGTILDNLPPAFAAKLTQEHPELKR